ncbi:hypothetical protein F442_08916 [Phytophthora nicotianae P10297]|uniref:Uncharacterized protein n=1 Tax=Phytophthora nicotianae P10297 TaxID=1317064 RepID=W2ZBN9_PHYNI|nr:hypothetical protein F442_08916 [Phytophthora nicotianae P10297]
MDPAPSKRERPISESDATLSAVKRIRLDVDEEVDRKQCAQLGSDSVTSQEQQCFPSEIQALPHVLKLIETMLLTPDEAITEAAKTGQSEWAQQILRRFECDTSEAFYQAAIRGDSVITEILLDKFLRYMNEQAIQKTEQAMQRAAKAAAEIGQLQIVQLLFSEIYIYRRAFTPMITAARDILDTATASGSLEVVKYMVNHAVSRQYMDEYSIFPEGDTLTRAIMGGQMEVVDFLLKYRGLRWNLRKAFLAAMDRGDKELTERIYNIYPQQFHNNSLFAYVAASGNLEAVKYLYNNGHDDEESVGKALKGAGGCKTGVEILKFLLDTGRVTQSAIDEAFQRAARQENMDVVTLVYNTKLVSQQGINRAFATVKNVAAMRLMYDNEKISERSLLRAFKLSTSRNGVHTVEILKFLYKEKCISSDLISNAFVAAVRNQQTELVHILRDDTRVTDQALSSAFGIAAIRDDTALVKLLYDYQRVSHGSLLKAFREATRHGRLEMAKVIVAFLFDEQHVPLVFKHRAFVLAVRLGFKPVVLLLCERKTDG